MENRNLFYFALILLIVSLIIFFININKVIEVTGKATGTANLTVEARIEVNFTTNILNWASGSVTSGKSQAVLASNGTVTNGNWTTVSSGLILENIGNKNVSLIFSAGKQASTFVGGTSPSYQWNFTNSGPSSCTFNVTTDTAVYYEINGTNRQVCNFFEFTDARDTLRVDMMLIIPSDANQTGSAIGDIITATATGL